MADNKVATINYIKYFKGSHTCTKPITHDELDKWTFNDFYNNGFTEVLNKGEYRRLYMDFDELKTVEDYISVEKWLNKLQRVIGSDYAICGYTTDKDFLNNLKRTRKFIQYIDPKDDKFKGYNTDFHTISIHVVFYEIVMSVEDIYSIFGENQDTYDNVNEFVDRKVYKEDANKDQLLRHPFSHKYVDPRNNSTCKLCGVDFEEIKCCYNASELVVTPRGDESVVNKDVWIEFFKPKNNKSHDERKNCKDEWKIVIPTKFPKLHVHDNNKSNSNENDSDSDDDITPEEAFKEVNNYNNTITKELFDLIVDGFKDLEIHGDAEKTTKEITLFPLFNALYACECDEISRDDINDAIDEIYENNINTMTDPAKDRWRTEKIRARKNTKPRTPGSLFIYLRTFNPDYYNQYIRPLISKNKVISYAKIDFKDDFLINNIRMKGEKDEYQKANNPKILDEDAVLNDLKRILVVVEPGCDFFFFKEFDAENDRMSVKCYSQDKAYNILKGLKVGYILNKKQEKEDVSALTIYKKHNALFFKNSVCFYSKNEKDFSFFQGYKYDPVQNDALIEKFNNHIRDVICSGDKSLFNYVQSWFATIIKEPLGRAYTALVFKGVEGTGKNTMTDVWSELLRGYSNSNVSNIDSIVGQFNTAVENKKLLVINEMNSADKKKNNPAFNGLKKLITEDSIDINTKNISVRCGVRNVANLVILSNEFNPVQISANDRRYCIITPSDAHVNDRAYFNDLFSQMRPDRSGPYNRDFMNALMYYYMNYEVNIDLAVIPETFERKMAKEANKSAIEEFVEEYADRLSKDGIEPMKCFKMFNDFIGKNRFKTNYKRTTFKAEMTKYCAFDNDGQLHRYKGKRVYRFTDAMIVRYAELAKQKEEEKEEEIEELLKQIDEE